MGSAAAPDNSNSYGSLGVLKRLTDHRIAGRLSAMLAVPGLFGLPVRSEFTRCPETCAEAGVQIFVALLVNEMLVIGV